MKNLNEWLKDENESKLTIAIDFDGVIHVNSKGFHDGTIYDKPIKGARKALKELYNNDFRLIIFTCKADPERPLINGKSGIELIWEWLEKYDMDQYIQEITYQKPRALYYIDDKGIRFENWKETLEVIRTNKCLDDVIGWKK